MCLRLPRLFPCRHQVEGLRAQLAAARLERRLAHWIDQAITARSQRDRAEADRDHTKATLAQALVDREELTGRVCYLERELEDLTRSRDELVAIADRVRGELRDLRAARGKRPVSAGGKR